MNPLKQLQQYRQSVWIDYIRRDMITNGELARFIEEDGVAGITSNPTIFEKAINENLDYDEALRKFLDTDPHLNLDAATVYESLSIEDIRMAADVLWPVYERTQRLMGTSVSRFRPIWHAILSAVSLRHAVYGGKWIVQM